MSGVRTDRPAAPLILYRVTTEPPSAVSAWTEDLAAASERGPVWWAQVAPERLLAYIPARREWVVDTRGLAVEKLDSGQRGRGADSALARQHARQ